MANENPNRARQPRRPGRPRPGRPVLTRSTILDAALAMVDESGLEALSMRRLAARLGVDAMSIYHHLPNKAAIISGLVETVFATTTPPPPTEGPWPDRVRAWARNYRDRAFAHPNLVLQIITDSAAASDATILISEPLYAAFQDAGLTPPEVVLAVGVLVDFVNGYTLALSGAPAADDAGPDPMEQRLADLSPDQAPTMRHVHASLHDRSPHGADYFESCLDIIIRGVSAHHPT